MPLIELPIKPGVVRDNSFLLSESRWIDADKVRFRRVGGRSQPETINGYEDLTEETFSGKCRALHSYETIDGIRQIVLGTSSRLYCYTGALLWDITPITANGTLGTALSTTNNSNIITVSHTTHGRLDNSIVYLRNDATIGGIDLGGSGTMTNGITTSQGSTTLTLSVASHGLSDGDRVSLNAATSVGGIPASELNITHTVYVVTPDQVLITSTTKATSDATGGGTVNWTAARGYSVTVVDANSYTIQASSNANASVSGAGGSTFYEYALNPGLENTTAGSGYSSGGYSEGYYSLPSSETDLRARVWTLSNAGELLVANFRNSPLYKWENVPSHRAVDIGIGATDAPNQSLTNMVTPEKFVFALGTKDQPSATFNPMQVAFATQYGATATGDWTPVNTNSAGDFILAEGNKIMAGMPMPFVSLIFTDTSLYSLTYLGGQDNTTVYRPTLVGTGCGLIGPNAAARAGDSGQVFWLSSSREFMTWGGGTPQTVSCGVRNFFFDNLAEGQEDLIFAATNEQFNEIWWFYPDKEPNENFRYVALNYSELHWTIGTFSITSWQERGVEEFPIAAFANGKLRIMEKSNTANGEAFPAYIESGLTDVQEGERLLSCRRYVPDFQGLTGAVNIKVKHRLWPQGTVSETDLGSVNSTTEKVDFRINARQIALRYDWGASSPTDGRIGRIMLDIMPTERTR